MKKIVTAVLLLLAAQTATAQMFDCTGFWEEKRCFHDDRGRLVCVCVDRRR
jgi:hypothetical protein